MSRRMDYERANRRQRMAELSLEDRLGQPQRRRRSHPAQHDTIRMLAAELGREPTFPEMAYDSRLEIERLGRLLETRRRMAA